MLYEMCALKPPFKGEDMEELYKKVIRGAYPRIPSQYSQELNNVISYLLKVDHNQRPNCSKIINILSQKIDDSMFVKVDEN